MRLPCVYTQFLLARALRYGKLPGEAMSPSPIYLQNMKNVKIQIDGNGPEWEHECWQNAESQNLFVLINFTLEMMAECHAIAKKHGYELKGKTSHTKPGVCHFIPRNYDTSKMTTPADFVFSGCPED